MDLDTATARALLAVAHRRHFGWAAADLGVSQQAVSKRIARLERELGVELVDRTNRFDIRLTATGHDLLPLAREFVDAGDRLLDCAGASSSGGARLRVDTMGEHLAPRDWIRRAGTRLGTGLKLVDRPADTTADHLLTRDRADLAFGRAGAMPVPWPKGLTHRLVLLEPLSLLTHAAHPWAQASEVPMGALDGKTLWFPMSGAPVEWRGYVAEFAQACGAQIITEGISYGFQYWVDDIAAGNRPPSIIGEGMRPPRADVAVVPIVDPTPVFPWSLLARPGVSGDQVQSCASAIGFGRPASAPTTDVWLPESDRRTLSG